MELPGWVIEVIRQYRPPETCEVQIRLELYKTGITKAKIGDVVTVKPPQK